MALTTRHRFEEAVESVQEDLEADDHVIAAFLCGSLSYDEVWDKSDVDLVVITTDEKLSKGNGIALVADDVNIHTSLLTRGEFKRDLDASQRNSFSHSMFARSRLLFSKDPSIYELYESLQKLGSHDLLMQSMNHAQIALVMLYKAKKWHLIKDDLHYTAHWVLMTANHLANVVVCRAGQLVDREAMVEATKLEPDLYQLIYTDLFDKKVTQDSLGKAIDAIDSYLEPLAEELFEPILEYLRGSGGEPRSSTELDFHFGRNYDVHHVVTACEWLSDLGIIEKASVPTKLTLYSQNQVDELAFFMF